MNILEFINSDHNINERDIGALCQKILSEKFNNHVITTRTDQHKAQLIKLVEAACKQDKEFNTVAMPYIVALSHIIDVTTLDEKTQNEAFLEIFLSESKEGLKSFLGVGFKASAKGDLNDRECNALELLAETSISYEAQDKSFYKNAAKMLIDVKKNNYDLEKQRSGLRKRTVEGENLPELRNIEKLLIFGLEKELIKVIEFSPSYNLEKYKTSGFEETIKNIFRDETRKNNLLENYEREAEKISNEYALASLRVNEIILNTIPELEKREFPQQAISSSQAVAATTPLSSELTPITPDPSTRKRIAEKVSTTTKKNEAEEEMVSSLKNGKGCCTIM